MICECCGIDLSDNVGQGQFLHRKYYGADCVDLLIHQACIIEPEDEETRLQLRAVLADVPMSQMWDRVQPENMQFDNPGQMRHYHSAVRHNWASKGK